MNNIAPKAPLARQANQMAGHGRYGDSQLVHMNPYEVQGLASMSPTGQLTTNPMTGQPEAFLPFLAPIIGSMLGTTALGGTALGMAGAGALGSGLATWAATGDFEKGLISGVTGFGLGKVLGAGADLNQGVSTALQGSEAAQTGLAASNTALAASGEAVPTLLAGPPTPTGYMSNVRGPGLGQGMKTFAGAEPLTNIAEGLSPAQLQNANLQAAVPNAMRDVNTARAALTPAQRMGGFTNGMDGLKAMGKQAMSPSSLLPIGVGVGTMAQVEQQETMENLRKEQLGEDRAYAQEFEDVLGNAIGVSNRSNQRQGRQTSSNPYSGRYATGGVVGMDEGGPTTGGAHNHPHDQGRVEYLDSINDAIFLGQNPNATILNSSFVPGSTTANTIEGDETTLTDPDVGKVVTNTAAGVDSLLDQGALLENITTNSGDAAAAVTKGWQDKMKDQINAATSGVKDGRYFLDAKAGTGAERQSFLKGDFKQKPPSDYRHGFEKEFQFFDYVKDRPVERYQDLFGAGASDYMAGLLAGNTGNAPAADTNTLAEAGDFSGTTGGISNVDSGVAELVPAESLKSTCYTANGDGTYTESESDITGVCPTGSFGTKVLADSSFVATTVVTTRKCYNAAGQSVDVAEGTNCPLTHPNETAPTNDVETTITCYDETGEFPSQQVTGVNPSCPLGFSTTAPADVETTITCYDETGEFPSQEVTGVNPSCPVGFSTTPPVAVNPLAGYGTDTGEVTDAEVLEMLSLVTEGIVSAEDVADQFTGVSLADVNSYLDVMAITEADNVDSYEQTDIDKVAKALNEGNITYAQVAAKFGVSEADVIANMSVINQRKDNAAELADSGSDVLNEIETITSNEAADAQAAADATAGEDASEPGNRSGLIRQYVTDTFGEPPYTQAQAIQFSQVAIDQGISAAESGEALGLDEATVEGFYQRASNPIDVVDAQAQTEAAAISGGDFSGMSEAEIAKVLGYRLRNGGRVGTKRFMTRLGPVELADGGIADIPADGQFMQEMPPEIPPEVAMVQEALMVEEPEVDYNDLIAMTVEAIKGNLEDSDSVINMFIEEYGVERFRELRNAVLQGIVPNAQTEGMIAGSGNGMDDEVMGMIGENQPVAVSPGEYIVAADVLSGLGDGDTNAGADVMDEVQANVRMARSGGRQPAPIDLSKVMPA